MIKFNRLLNIEKTFKENNFRELQVQDQESTLFMETEVPDTTSILSRKSEKFANVKAELDKNIPDQTATLEDKIKAISYIDRMLKCIDITPKMKDYWTNKKNIIEMETQTIKNEQKNNKNEKWEDIAKEFSNFTDKYWVKNVLNHKSNLDNLEFNDAQEYYNTVRRTMISFCDRILNSSNLPNDKKEYYTNLKNDFHCDLNSYAADTNNYNKMHNQKTERFDDVFTEMSNNIPSQTSTINEKQLALSYIERLLSCDDIPNEGYWKNKSDVIKMEIAAIQNLEITGENTTTTSFKKAIENYNDFAQEYWNKKPKVDNIEDKTEYWITYHKTCQTYIQKILDYNTLPNDMRENFLTDFTSHQKDINEQLKLLKNYQNG